jgi:glucose/arabinose dehydrogenase
MRVTFILAAAAILLAGCGESATLTVDQGTGPDPKLPPPAKTMFPTVEVAEATGWPAGAMPVAPAGLRVNEFAGGLDHPRSLLVLPNGDILVAEANKPPKPEEKKGGIKEWIAGMIMSSAGAGVPSANRISLLRDADRDGVAELKTPFLTGLFSPFGMALVGDTLYVANADALLAFRYTPGATSIAGPGRKVADLPAGRNHHWTKALEASPDGKRLYVGVGSNSNVAEHGMGEEVNRAAVLEIDPATGASRLYASGLRNPTGLAFLPGAATLYAVVNERDELGSDLVPDYLTRVDAGAFYGWPWSYWGNVDTRVKPPRPEMVAKARKPDYALGPHVAPLGIGFAQGQQLGPRFASGAFVGLHGSWNRKPRSGYKVVFVPFAGGTPTGLPVDVLDGFVSAEGKAMGRPVGVRIAADGSLLVADDVGNKIWRVSAAQAMAAR